MKKERIKFAFIINLDIMVRNAKAGELLQHYSLKILGKPKGIVQK